MRYLVIISLTFLSCTAVKPKKSFTDFYRYTTEKSITAKNGAVVSAHPLASLAGLWVMQQGGNAFDAAIATQFALAVVYPGAGNLGGGGFMVACTADGKQLALDFRETAPASAHADMYLDTMGNVVPGKSLNGHLSAGVPGTVAGIFETLPYAKLPLKTLMAPAIALAENGFSLTENEAGQLNTYRNDFLKYNTRPTAFVKETTWKAGDTLVQKELAATLLRILNKGAAGFYGGETARLLVAEMKRGGGVITGNDLKHYKARWRSPQTFTYKEYQVVSMPMPSSGGLLLQQMMKMTEPVQIGKWGVHHPNAMQRMIETERLAFADRAAYMGDPDFVSVPVQALSDSLYLQKRSAGIPVGTAGKSSAVKPGLTKKESEETTHISIADKDGNAVSITTTLNASYGSRTVVGGAGFLLNNEMDDFSVKPGVPNLYGAVGGKANAIAAGKRMLSSMTPTIVLKNNKPYLVVGSPGGTTIPTSVYQVVMNMIEFGLSAEDAVNLPRFHHQWLPDEVFAEEGFSDASIFALKNMGYTITHKPSIGRVELILFLSNGSLKAVADKRGDDSAAGW